MTQAASAFIKLTGPNLTLSPMTEESDAGGAAVSFVGETSTTVSVKSLL